MERETEIKRLLNVLRRMGRTARLNHWTGTREQADAYSAEQYNRILARLRELDEGLRDLFPPLPENASWDTVGNACRDLSAYYEEEPSGKPAGGWSGVWTDPRGIWIDRAAFRGGMPPEVNELGEFLREKMAEWQNDRRHRGKPE